MEMDRCFTLTEEEVARRKRYLEITQEDEARLREAHPLIQAQAPRIIARFYDYLLSHEHTRRMLEAPGLIERLKSIQLKYFLELTSGRYDLAYCENRLRVGETHYRVGLSPEWYIGAYVKYLHIVADVLSAAFGRDQERFFQVLVSLTKVIYLDTGLAIDVYHQSAQSELRRKALALEATNAQLLQLQTAKRFLTDTIVHDLQNPLAGIQGLLQVLETRSRNQPDEVREAIREGLRRCLDLSEMIQNVLHISRAESGRLEAHMEDVDLAAVISGVAQSTRRQFEQAGRKLTLDLPASCILRTDEYLVRRIAENLLRNTLRHTPEGTPVIVRLAGTASLAVRLSVVDQGPGIPRELQPLLFDPFGAPELRKAGLRVDTGLGLAFCRAASSALGAGLEVESDGRSGTAIHLVLPASHIPPS
jgi:signal transduction histidine kinase